uniref:B-cell receptor CD22 n=1 Tax=Sparus aurata TaxID=8175 RepID=A0A671Y2I2_SPAAU
MFVLIWAALLFSVRGSNAGTGASAGVKTCPNGSCFNLNEGEKPAVAGLCVVIPCSFNLTSDYKTQNMIWFKCNSSKPGKCDSEVIFHTNEKETVQPEFKGRVSLLEPDLGQNNCSIIINDLTQSDSGPYQLRVEGLVVNKSKGFTSRRVKVSVTDVIQKPTVMIPPLTEGQQTTLTCTAPGLCSGSDPTITWTWSGHRKKGAHITGHTTEFKTENVTSVTQRHSSTLNFDASAEHNGTNVTCKVRFINNITTEETVTLNVTSLSRPEITGVTEVKEGDVLNLTCSVESFRPSVITWTKPGSNKNLQNETTIHLQNETGTATLVILNVTSEHSGRYICTAGLQNATLAKHADVNVTFSPRILESSSCEVESEVLTCTCISEGFPPPTIKFPMLDNYSEYTEYSVCTTVSRHTVRVTVSLKHHNYATAECVSISGQEARKNLTVNIKEFQPKDLFQELLIIVQQPQVIISFLIGILLSSTICCLARICCRKKQKSPEKMEEMLEMVTAQVIPLMDGGQVVGNGGTHDQEADGAEAAAQSVPECDAERKEVEYSALDFSACKQKSPTEDTRETTETEGKISSYAGRDHLNHRIRMFPLIWMTLLFTERSSFVNTVASPGDPPEISAVAGLCVVIPCNLTADSGFTLESAAWYKCEQNCTDSELKLSMNNTNSNAQPGFRGRVSLLEPDLGNCSIIINDLTSSDSGSYQLIVLNGTTQGFTFHRAVKITVQDLTQKPTVTIPPLTEGQQTTLTCTAPGLCSGSVPAITWTWSGRREKSSHIAGNITASKTENVTGVTQRHSSTLTFNSSAEHHGTNVTCKVSFINNITTEETVTLNVTCE